MSGHSKWHQIKHKKDIADQKRGQLFSKLLNAIAIAARENPNPDFNPRLRGAIEKARAQNVPSDNIERAVRKSGAANNLEEIVIEAYGPEKAALIIRGVSHNKNRTVAEVKKILADHEAKMAEPGSVLWAFSAEGPLRRSEDEASGSLPAVRHGTSGGEKKWQPKFKQSVSEAAKNKIAALIEDLEEREDVQGVITNVQ